MNALSQSCSTAVFTDSSELLAAEEFDLLRARASQDGYLFFRKLLPRDTVMQVRSAILDVVDSFGWRVNGQDKWGGLVDVLKLNQIPIDDMRLDIGVSTKCYNQVQTLESVHRLPHHPNLLKIYRGLFASEVLVHPRHIVRMITPHASMVPTPPHQDFPLIQGTANTWTAWIPMGDCPRENGGLTVLRGSNNNGYIPVVESKGAGGLAVPLCPHEVDWLSCDYLAGDVLTFPSYTVHRALRSQTKNQIRLSLDVRFQSAEEVVEEKSLKPHCEMTWDEIYSEWKSDELKYYWCKENGIKLAPWDDMLRKPARRIC